MSRMKRLSLKLLLHGVLSREMEEVKVRGGGGVAAAFGFNPLTTS